MADLSIRNDFLGGTQEIFTTMFNDGVSDGLDLYLLSDKTKTSSYGESKVKIYKAPIKLVTQARINPTQGEQDVETVKGDAQFVVPLKDMMDKDIDVSVKGLAVLRKGVIDFHGTFYTIDNILPKAYVEDVFLLYTFVCTEDLALSASGVFVEEVEEGGGEDGSSTENDGGLE